MRISDWSSDVCSSDLEAGADEEVGGRAEYGDRTAAAEQPALVVAEVDAVAEQRARAEQAEALVDRGVALRPGKQAAHRLDLAAVLAEVGLQVAVRVRAQQRAGRLELRISGGDRETERHGVGMPPLPGLALAQRPRP